MGQGHQSGVKKDPPEQGFPQSLKKGLSETPNRGLVLACSTRGLQSLAEKTIRMDGFFKTAPPRTSRCLQNRKHGGVQTPPNPRKGPKRPPGGPKSPPRGAKKPLLDTRGGPIGPPKIKWLAKCKIFIVYFPKKVYIYLFSCLVC